MNWMNIIKRSGGTINPKAKIHIEKVIGSDPLSINEILDLLWDEVENREASSHRAKTSRNIIPTRGELVFYLGHHPNYESAIFDKNNQRVERSNKSRKNIRKYWVRGSQ